MKTPFLHLVPMVIAICSEAIAADSSTPPPSPAPLKDKAKADEKLPPSLRTPMIDQRQESLRMAIVRGVQNGELTDGEAKSLGTKLDRLARMEKTMKGNDTLSGKERQRLIQETREIADDIFKQCNDASKREVPATSPRK